MIRTICEFTIEEILPQIGLDKPRMKLSGFSVNAQSLRLQCFVRSLECVWCHRAGNIFLLQGEGTPHVNLFHRAKNGHMTLMTKDHIIPSSKGGKDCIENLQTMCANCNNHKADSMENISF